MTATTQDHPMPTDSPRPHEDLIDLWLDHLRLLRRSPGTIDTYRYIALHAHRKLPYGLPSATQEELERWVGQAASASTQSVRTAAVAGFFEWAVDRGHLDFSPASALPKVRVPFRLREAATDQQLAIVLDRVPEHVRLWSLIAAYSGARAIEIGRMDRDHIGEHVRLFGKGDKERMVPTHPLLAEAVEGLPPGPITERTGDQLRRHARWVYHRAGVPIGIHRLRAWFGNTMLQAGHDLATVQDLMGHSSPNTTRRYATPSSAQFTAAVAALPTVAPRSAVDDAPGLAAAASGPK